LLLASGYASCPKDFDALIRILVGEIRLLTSTGPEGKEVAGEPVSPTPNARYYQLTHDYLVPSLRDWLTRKQKETRRGRAEVRLMELAALWGPRRERRYLPGWWQWLYLCLITRSQNWTAPQREMMRRASTYHTTRSLVAAAALVLVTLIAVNLVTRIVNQNRTETRATALVDQNLDEQDSTRLPDLIALLKDDRSWTDPQLEAAYADAERTESAERTPDTDRQQLNAALARLASASAPLPADDKRVVYLWERFLAGSPQESP